MSDAVKKTVESKSLTKMTALGVIVFSVIEAVAAFFLVFKPLFINSIYHNDYLDEHGYTYAVSFFGNLFMSEAEKASGTVMLSLSGAVFNIIVIYLVMTAVPIFFAVMLLKKNYAFTKTGLTAVFGAKTVIGFVPLLVPFANVRRSMWIFGTVDAVLCFAACAFFVYLNSIEYADDMLFDDEQTKAMVKRGKFGGLLFLLMAALAVCEKNAMAGYGINWSIIIGKDNQQLMQGYILVGLLALALIAAIVYVRGVDASLYYFAGFGCAVALSNVYAVIQKVIWVNTTYKQQKALKNQGDAAAAEWIASNGMGATWWRRTIFIVVCLLIGGAVGVMAFMKVRKKLFRKPDADEKKPALMNWICSGALVLCFLLSVIAALRWDTKIYSSFVMGAMDYMYFIVYGGVTLFLALSMLGGVSFSKWGALALYIIVGASNFTTVFKVFGERKKLVASYPGYHGYDYIITGIMFILTLLCCLTIIIMFAYKEMNDYMYNKHNS